MRALLNIAYTALSFGNDADEQRELNAILEREPRPEGSTDRPRASGQNRNLGALLRAAALPQFGAPPPRRPPARPATADGTA